MSNFECEICGTAILEGAGGGYVTGCEHYPLKIKNPWHKRGKQQYGPEYYDTENMEMVAEEGDYRIFEQTKECYLHTYKDTAVTQLVKPSMEALKSEAHSNKGEMK